jgi:hypothetical protein
MLKTRLLHPEILAPLGAPCQGAGVLIADGISADLRALLTGLQSEPHGRWVFNGIGVRLPDAGSGPTGRPPAKRPVTGGGP